MLKITTTQHKHGLLRSGLLFGSVRFVDSLVRRVLIIEGTLIFFDFHNFQARQMKIDTMAVETITDDII